MLHPLHPLHPPRSRPFVLAALTAATVALAGCASMPAAPDASSTASSAASSGDGHGAIAGAAELAEPALGLTSVDPGGVVTHLDLLDESTVELGRIDPPRGMHTDGRYLFVDSGEGVTVVDSGVWTWDHVDHFHYYRAEPRVVGTVPGEGAATVVTTNSSTTGGTGIVFSGSDEAVLLDTHALSQGALVESFRLEAAGASLVVPIGSAALLVGRDGAVQGRDAAGTELADVTAECPAPGGAITTRVGAALSCADGALLATTADDAPVIEHIPYPPGAAPATTGLANREGRPSVAALSADGTIQVLDTRERSWALLPAPMPLVAVTAVDDDAEHVLGLSTDGRVVVLDGASGALISQTEPLATASLTDGPVPTLIADQQRAYLAAPAEQRLYEIDFADSVRIARTFDTATVPAFVAETGR